MFLSGSQQPSSGEAPKSPVKHSKAKEELREKVAFKIATGSRRKSRSRSRSRSRGRRNRRTSPSAIDPIKAESPVGLKVRAKLAIY